MAADFAGKVAVVTGGGRGIGRAIVLELARRGADVVVNYLRNEAAAEQTAQEARALGVRAVALRAHVGDPGKVERLFQQVGEQLGGLDILVNNAASGVIRSALELEPHHWDWTMNINARGAWLAARAAAPLMDGRGGSIVNLSSLGSQRVLPEYVAVGVSKAALEAVTRYLAVELAPRGIVVNAVAGGLVETDALQHFARRDQMLADARTRTPAGRMVEPEDIARVVAFLCTDDARMIRGQVIVVDGGYSLPT
ncbi:MAG: enoyl-[acyl-carrier-protein] reductase FabL [Chloroflexi bacterium]|nr:enoyl-[acyl-carrier-protein] reductase FabL [Chloroflexota bacterium]